MDPLSDLLRVVRLEGAYFYAGEAAEPWRIETVAAQELSPRIMPAAEHLISYHILTEGRCYGGLAGEEQVELTSGDVIAFPHGDAHAMSSGPDVRGGPDVATSAPARTPTSSFSATTDHVARRSFAGFSAATAGRPAPMASSPDWLS